LLDCVILGDSIAVGVGQARPDCQTVALTGISSERFVQMFPGAPQARTAIISLGVNDGEGAATADNLARLRGRVVANTVYWLLSGTNEHIRDAVRVIAGRFGDRLIDVAPLAGPDHIHPDRAGYAQLASETRGVGGGGSSQTTAYRDFTQQNWTFQNFPGMKVWNGPDNLNGVPMKQYGAAGGSPGLIIGTGPGKLARP
jgi:lysophospholipase L1-like esterase